MFFLHSGAEANETLFKLARKFGNETVEAAGSLNDGAPGGRALPTPVMKLITFDNSFHGRTLAGISATGQEKVKHGFEPPVDGFRHVPFNDLDAVAEGVGPKTAAILLEPIQEKVDSTATAEFLRGLRRLATSETVADV